MGTSLLQVLQFMVWAIAALLAVEAVLIVLFLVWCGVSSAIVATKADWAAPFDAAFARCDSELVIAGHAVASGVPTWLVWPHVFLGFLDGVVAALYPPRLRAHRFRLAQRTGEQFSPVLVRLRDAVGRAAWKCRAWNEWWEARPTRSAATVARAAHDRVPTSPHQPQVVVLPPMWPSDPSLN